MEKIWNKRNLLIGNYKRQIATKKLKIYSKFCDF